MSKAQELITKLDEGKVLTHIEGSPGAGKTTLMNKLRKDFPQFVFADLDWFRNAAVNSMPKIKSKLTSDQLTERLKEISKRSQEELDKWLKKQSKPAVLFGLGGNFTMDITDPSGKIILSTSPLKSAYRNYKRQKNWEKEAGYPPGSITDRVEKFIRDVLYDVSFRKYAKRDLGYKPIKPKRVKSHLKEISRRVSNE
jgi:hypothetical protein